MQGMFNGRDKTAEQTPYKHKGRVIVQKKEKYREGKERQKMREWMRIKGEEKTNRVEGRKK